MDLVLRPLRAEDVHQLVDITGETGFFRQEEVEVAREVIMEAAKKGEASGYHVQVATEGEQPVGYVCFGPTPMTRGAWDIYWIAVHPRGQRRGIGSRLMDHAEREIGRRAGRLALVETSSLEHYEPTRRFYLSRGYAEVSRIANFYDIGDAKVTYAKPIPTGGTMATPP